MNHQPGARNLGIQYGPMRSVCLRSLLYSTTIMVSAVLGRNGVEEPRRCSC